MVVSVRCECEAQRLTYLLALMKISQTGCFFNDRADVAHHRASKAVEVAAAIRILWGAWNRTVTRMSRTKGRKLLIQTECAAVFDRDQGPQSYVLDLTQLLLFLPLLFASLPAHNPPPL